MPAKKTTTKKTTKKDQENKFLKIIVISNLVILSIITIMLIVISFQLMNIQKGNSSSNSNSKLEDFDFKVDDKNYISSYGGAWGEGIFAPFVDITAWVNGDYSVNGVLNLGKIMDETNIKYFNLGFINTTSGIKDNKLNWGFGGYSVLAEGQNNSQYDGIKQVMSDIRSKGGDFTISFGGLLQKNFFEATTNVDILVNSYLDVIDGFNLTRIDLDIEGTSQHSYTSNTNNAKAIKKVQELTNVEVVLTLPVMPEGLINPGLSTVQAYLDEGVDITAVNIMAMCYGESYKDRYDTGSIEAVDSTMNQIKTLYQNKGINLSTEEAYKKVGITTSIGFEEVTHPIFTTSFSQLVVDHCIKKKINFVSFWSLNRDSMTQDNIGIKNKYEHTKIYLKFQK